jgi:hypothetical protein
MASRREFLFSLATATAGAGLGVRTKPAGVFPQRESSLLAALRAGDPATRALLRAPAAPCRVPAQALPPLVQRFSDLPRHFLFEYYPWYHADPWFHWDQWDRRPPDDIAANYVPRLGPYDSRSRPLIEQHARWIADSGAGGVSLSWWGPGSTEDGLVPLLMDVMRDHGLKVAFHLEPYAADHGARWQEDVLYLLREYGDRRRYDCLLLLEDEDGGAGPVFKGFRTIVPRESTDCHGVVRPVSDYTPDDVYARQFDALRKVLRGAFDHVTLLADSLDFVRAPRAGFDGIAIYDNFVEPRLYLPAAQRATSAGLVFSFNVNPGFDAIAPRVIAPDSCYGGPPPFAPAADAFEWSRADERERAARLSAARVGESLRETLAVQTNPQLLNAGRGFFLVYLNSFNEWHEGHAFEPMKDAGALSAAERRLGYHNPERGDYRLELVRRALRELLSPPQAEGGSRAA